MHLEITEFRVNIPWVPPSYGQLLMKWIFWDYDEQLLLICFKVTFPPDVFHCVVLSGTPVWNTLEQFSHTTRLILTRVWIIVMHMKICLSTWAPTWLLKVIFWFLPLYPEKDEHHCVHFLWDSLDNGILYINKTNWNAHGDPFWLFGKFIGHQRDGDYYLEAFPNTSTWRQIKFCLLDFKQFREDASTNQHIFGELTSFMSTYLEFWLSILLLIFVQKRIKFNNNGWFSW